MDPSANLASAQRSGVNVTVGANTPIVCTEIRQYTKSIAMDREYARIDRTNVASLAVLTEQGRPTIDIVAEFYMADATKDLLLNEQDGHRLIFAERANGDTLCGVFDIISSSQQGRDSTGDAFWAITLSSVTNDAPNWVSA